MPRSRDVTMGSSTAEVLFNLTPTQAELKSVKWNSQKTKLEASGKINDFNNPRLEATYNLTIDLHQLGSVARVPQLRAGVVEVHGRGSYSLQGFGSAGKVFVRRLHWRQPGMTLENADLSGAFVATNKELSVSQLAAHALGGTITGRVDVNNWLITSSTAKGQHAQAGTARLQLVGIDVAQVAAAFSSPSLPLERVNAIGSGAGR